MYCRICHTGMVVPATDRDELCIFCYYEPVKYPYLFIVGVLSQTQACTYQELRVILHHYEAYLNELPATDKARMATVFEAAEFTGKLFRLGVLPLPMF